MSAQLLKNISSVLDEHTQILAKKVSERYNIPVSDIMRLWNDEYQSPPTSTPTPTPKSMPMPTPKSTPTPTPSTTRVCQHIWSKGDRKGTICGVQVNNPVRCYCSKHIAQNSKTKKEASSPVKKAIVLRRNKSLDKLWHQESGMVFESIADKRVIGKYVNGVMNRIGDEDRGVCVDLGFVVKEDPMEVDPSPSEEDTVADQISEVTGLLNGMLMGGDESDIEEEE